MLLKKLVFDSYKTYYGQQSVELYIPRDIREKENKNIILLGGLNGAGKTTILKAILYVLFGKRGMSEVEYKKLFSNVINNTFFDEGGRSCSVTLIIETDREEEWKLQVKWYFDNLKRVTNEERNLSIKAPGSKHERHARIDNIEAYNKFIDRVIPYHAAPFFIFDGEEIKDIILRQESSEMRAAIQKITGIEAYKILLEDLNSIKKGYENVLSKALDTSKLGHFQKEKVELENEISKREKTIAKLEEEKTKYLRQISEAKEQRNKKVLQNSKSRETIIKNQAKLTTELELEKQNYSKLFLENATNIILSSKINKLKKSIQIEEDYKKKKIIQEMSLTPYRTFMEQLLDRTLTPPLSEQQLGQLKQIGEEIWVKENKIQQQSFEEIKEIHDLSTKDSTLIHGIRTTSYDLIVSKINRIEKLEHDLQFIEQEIRNAPEMVDTNEDNDKIDIFTKKLGEIELRLKTIKPKQAIAKEKLSTIMNNVTRLSQQNNNFSDIKKSLDYINKLIKITTLYIGQTTNLKAQFIHDEFSKMLNTLFRKQDEFGKIEFDLNTYSIRLYNDRGQEISINDRSAGEMQMISSALIWALTKVSDLSLPMVIDTPLGRLDSYHRNHLINHYYKELCDQVIILSTDTEITKEYVDLMKDSSYRQYMLDYNENKKYTVIRDGYFDFVGVK
ncbi:ATPase [Bacillus sp. FJAT-25509]|uniref:DNA sulfur modification protein DndD n=1 Tax=Bacillus sp. FJAT-25509 TaxID=1712029 RepID=UPI0006F61904|nr:DNA sulfur modification protein DndD [Bacillus sp. FJAT-25509]KQL33522.1 ATPase [Bacillus sp. FJAT-25509]